MSLRHPKLSFKSIGIRVVILFGVALTVFHSHNALKQIQFPENFSFEPSIDNDRPLMSFAEENTQLHRTAILWTGIGLLSECDVQHLRHMVLSSPGMNVWALTGHSQLSEEDRNLSLSNIQSIPGLFNTEQMESLTETQLESKLNWRGHSGTSKHSMVKFLVDNADRYDFGWSVEADVRYTGPWIEIFEDEGRDNLTDFVTGKISEKSSKWSLAPIKINEQRSTAYIQVGWQLARISTKLARALWDGINEGPTIVGHHEAIIYPLALLHNFTMRQMDMQKMVKWTFGLRVERKFGQSLTHPGMLMHPLKCNPYEGNLTQDYETYVLRPKESRKDLLEQLPSLPLIPVYVIVSEENNSPLRLATKINTTQALRNLGSMRPTHLVELQGVNTTTVAQWIVNGKLQLWNTSATQTVGNFDPLMNETRHFSYPSYANIAKSLSFCEAILQAYHDEHEMVLIMDDKTFFPRISASILQGELQYASKRRKDSWQHVVLRNTRAHHAYPTGPAGWEDWHKNHTVHAFLVHRRGMESILNKTYYAGDQESSTNGVFRWRLPFVSEPLFELAKTLVTKSILIPGMDTLASSAALGFHGSVFAGISPEFM